MKKQPVAKPQLVVTTAHRRLKIATRKLLRFIEGMERESALRLPYPGYQAIMADVRKLVDG